MRWLCPRRVVDRGRPDPPPFVRFVRNTEEGGVVMSGNTWSKQELSAQPCGCDSAARWMCREHTEAAKRQGAAQAGLGGISVRPKDAFVVKDSGAREVYDSGMQRDTADNKVDYTLALDGPMFERYAEHLRKGALKYGKRNWTKAEGSTELERFRSSALRHLLQWLKGDTDEDHAAAVWFNINGAEYVIGRMANRALPPRPGEHK